MITRKDEIQKTDNINNCVLIPETDIYETENEYSLKLEMPGVKKEKINITLDNSELEINGETEAYDNKKELKYSEFKLFYYKRKFKIGNDIDREKIDANLDNGVLTLTLHKKEEVKPKRIEVKAS